MTMHCHDQKVKNNFAIKKEKHNVLNVKINSLKLKIVSHNKALKKL